MSTRTPWGPSQSTHKITRGITFYSTAGHGGFKVAPTLLAKMPQAWRRTGGWFEEDCDACLVILAFPHLFTPQQQESALQGAKCFLPDELRAAGYEVREEESLVLQQRAFTYKHSCDYVVHAAWGDWHKAVPPGQVAVVAYQATTQTEAFFLVPLEEYAARTGPHPFIIDPSRHPRCPPLR